MHLLGSNAFAISVLQRTGLKNDTIQQGYGLKYCPSMDLVAVFPQIHPSDEAIKLANTTTDEELENFDEVEQGVLLEVFRLNGQRAFASIIDSKAGTVGIVDVSWRSDGKILSVATSDNQIRLINSFTGKIIQIFTSTSVIEAEQSTDRESPMSKRKSATLFNQLRNKRCMPTAISYSAHFMSPAEIQTHLAKDQEEFGRSLDELQGLNVDVKTMLKLKPNLPRDFASIDIEQYLPKLAVLPANGLGEEDIFSTRTSLDAMFQPVRQHNQALTTNVIAVAHTDAHVHIRIFDSFEIGDININTSHNQRSNQSSDRILRIISHPFSHRIFFLVQSELAALTSPSRHTRSKNFSDVDTTSLHLVALNLNFLKDLPWTISVLATKATQLQNLIRYIHQIESQLTREVKTAFDLPRRFLSALDGDLQEEDGEGNTFETCAYHAMLTGEVGGKFKEWLTDVLNERNVKRWEKAVFDCLDLIRNLTEQNLIPAIERIGLVTATLRSLLAAYPSLGYDSNQLDGLRDTIDIMAILCEDLMKDVNNETTGFLSFMKWLKVEVEMAGLEETSEKLEELRENSDQTDTMKVFRYIQDHLRNTSVKKYLHHNPVNNQWIEDPENSMYAKYKRIRLKGKYEGVLSLKSLTKRLEDLCQSLFLHIANHLRDGITTDNLEELNCDLDGRLIDARIVSQPDHTCLHIIGSTSSSNQLRIVSQVLDSAQRRSLQTIKSILLEEGDEVIDVAIADDRNILALTRNERKVRIIAVPIEKPSQHLTKHQFGDSEDIFAKLGMQPTKLEVNGRKGRRTVTVGDKGGTGYAVFDMDSTEIKDVT